MPPTRAFHRKWLFVCTLTIALPIGQIAFAEFKPPPGEYRTSWVGNSLGGDGGANGFGYWVQNSADEIEVTPDGTVIAGSEWDEAGRCVGLYKDGRVNRVLLKEHEGKGRETAWGWGTANNAVAVDGEHLYVANKGKKLLHFRWKPGDLDSAHFVEEAAMRAEAVGLSARGQRIAVVYSDELEIRDYKDLKILSRFSIRGARDAAIAADGSLWILANWNVCHYSQDGKNLGVSLAGLDRPSALAFGHYKDRLLVCDDGACQQVLIFEVAGAPKLIDTFGERGGLRAGTAGLAAAKKLFGLRGAGMDAAGNLYVALGFAGGPSGNLMLRSFAPNGDLRWELSSVSFVDTFGFDPASDGAAVYGRTAIFDLDLSQTKAGHEWRLRGLSLDYPHRTDENRLKYGCSVVVRNLKGRRLLYTIGQYAGGYRLHTFDEPGGLVAHEVDRIGDKEQWAWCVDERGDIWHGDAAGKTIRRYPFKGWKAGGKPDYDWRRPQGWPWPNDFELVRRILFQPSTDSLYLFGYLKGQKIESWGVVGPTARRYDGWLSGKKTVHWTNRALPMNPRGSDDSKPLTPSAVDIAGDYLFAGMVKPDDGKQYTHILRLSDGEYVGSLNPGHEVGGQAGWQDMPYSIQAFRRKNGEYLILAEEDFRGKNLLYRWRPENKDGASGK